MRHNTYNYFAAFSRMAEHSCKAADMLASCFTEYDPDHLESHLAAMHEIESAADVEHHAILTRLAREFVTPIEREDIMELAQQLDEVTDSLEDVLIRMYMFNIPYVPQEALAMTEIIQKCCQALKQALSVFENFKKSHEIHEFIVNINHLEEEGDDIYMKAMRKLSLNCSDPLRVLAWTTTYTYMEKCCDACEHVANAMESTMMKNT